jgi:GH15 family glucan-1,4-alpha-glucosidase
MEPSPKIGDYALIGNCRSAALVNKYGSIDWCCLPEFHSPAVFAALLDREKGGCLSIAPTGNFHSFQRYISDTNVVETVFQTNGGEVKLTDAFVATTEEEKKRSLFPDHEILRMVQCTSGTMQLGMEFSPTLFYGKRRAELEDNKKLGIKFSWKENSFVLLTTLPIEQIHVGQSKASAQFILRERESALFSFSCSRQSPAVLPELQITGWERMQQTIDYWKSWISQCHYKGIYRDLVRRSALALKLLSHAPSGAIIAAPTTSLPEDPGGKRNWDYRYCWLRDASFTVRALINLGFKEEAHAYMNWILHATQLTQPKLQVLYSVYGQARLKEQEIHWMEGYENSKPVRIGNGAYSQLQLDVYGEVLDAFFSYSKLVKEFDRSSRKFILGLAEVICKQWSHPDNGIWEVRSSPAHHTHSKVMAWVGLDRVLKLCRKYKWSNIPIEKYEGIKKEIGQQIEQFGYNTELNSYTREFNGNSLDASSLVFSLVGYCSAHSPKMLSTIQRISQQLSENKLLFRYRSADGVSGSEGAFGICNFWLSENLAKAGDLKGAMAVFETLQKGASPSGLFSEEIDPGSYKLRGNYPQGFTHIGLINAALSINKALLKETGTYEH